MTSIDTSWMPDEAVAVVLDAVNEVGMTVDNLEHPKEADFAADIVRRLTVAYLDREED